MITIEQQNKNIVERLKEERVLEKKRHDANNFMKGVDHLTPDEKSNDEVEWADLWESIRN